MSNGFDHINLVAWNSNEGKTVQETTFDNDVFSAIAAGQSCAIAQSQSKDKKIKAQGAQGVEFFKGIAKKGNIASLTSKEQSMIRLWYMRSLEG